MAEKNVILDIRDIVKNNPSGVDYIFQINSILIEADQKNYKDDQIVKLMEDLKKGQLILNLFNIILLKNHFKEFQILNKNELIIFTDLDQIKKFYSLSLFQDLINFQMGKIGGTKEFDEKMKFYSYMMQFVINVYLKPKFQFKPKILMEDLEKMSPQQRNHIRYTNQNDPDIILQFFDKKFDLKNFAIQAVQKFFLNVSWRWCCMDSTAHIESLEMILIIFEMGLFEFKELYNLITVIFKASKRMNSLGIYIKKDFKKRNFTKDYEKQCIESEFKAREFIGKIYIMMITQYLDQNFLTDSENLEFNFGLFNQNKLYTHLIFSLLNFVSKDRSLKPSSQRNTLSIIKINKIIFEFLSDQNEDFYFNCLNFAHEGIEWKIENFSTIKNIIDLGNITIKSVSKIKISGTIAEYDSFMKNCWRITGKIRQFVNQREQKKALEILAVYQIDNFLLNFYQILLSKNYEQLNHLKKELVSEINELLILLIPYSQNHYFLVQETFQLLDFESEYFSLMARYLEVIIKEDIQIPQFEKIIEEYHSLTSSFHKNSNFVSENQRIFLWIVNKNLKREYFKENVVQSMRILTGQLLNRLIQKKIMAEEPIKSYADQLEIEGINEFQCLLSYAQLFCKLNLEMECSYIEFNINLEEILEIEDDSLEILRIYLDIFNNYSLYKHCTDYSCIKEKCISKDILNLELMPNLLNFGLNFLEKNYQKNKKINFLMRHYLPLLLKISTTIFTNYLISNYEHQYKYYCIFIKSLNNFDSLFQQIHQLIQDFDSESDQEESLEDQKICLKFIRNVQKESPFLFNSNKGSTQYEERFIGYQFMCKLINFYSVQPSFCKYIRMYIPQQQKIDNHDSHQDLNPTQKIYIKTKQQYFKNIKSNKVIEIISSHDVNKNNTQMYIFYLLNQFKNLSLHDHQIYHDLELSNILMSHNEKFRELFYDFLTKDNNKEIHQESFLNFYIIQRKLMNRVVNNQFDMKISHKIFKRFNIANRFLQNLCENNFVYFKEWFNTHKYYQLQNQTFLTTFYTDLKQIMKLSQISFNRQNRIILSDNLRLFKVIDRMIEGFSEFVNGTALKNKKYIYKQNIGNWVGIILRDMIQVNDSFLSIKIQILDYLMGLMETNDVQIAGFIGNNFPVNKLYLNMIKTTKLLILSVENKMNGIKKEITQQSLDDFKIKNLNELLYLYKKNDQEFSDSQMMSIIIKVNQLIKHLSNFIPSYDNFLIEKEEQLKQSQSMLKTQDQEMIILSFLKEIIIEIEFTNEEGILKTIFFKKISQCFFLNNQVKQDFQTNMNINSLDEKHEDFFKKIIQYEQIMEDEKNIFQNSPLLFKLTSSGQFFYYRVFLYILSALINLNFILQYDDDTKEIKNQFNLVGWVVTSFSIISIVFSTFCLILWFIIKYKTNRKILWKEFYRINPDIEKPKFYQIFIIVFYKSILVNPNFQTFFLNLLFNFMGMFMTPFYYTLLLLLIVYLSSLIYNVVLSFLVNTDKLFFTFVIILVVLNSFAFLLASNFRNQFEEEMVGIQSLRVCDTYFRCFLNTVNMGMRGGGGVSDYMILQGDQTRSDYIARFFFDIFFFIFVNLVLLGIFFGIIVDSFGELRDNMNKREQDINNMCFTCGIGRSTLEKKGINFENHIKKHDIWKYFFYIQFLKNKPSNSYNSYEICIWKKIQDNYNTSWLPKEENFIQKYF